MGQLDGAVCIFDLDGTLVDSAPDLSGALSTLLSRVGLGAIDPAVVRPFVGHGARALLEKGYAHHGKTFPSGETGEALVNDYVETYAGRIAELSKPFDGVEETLRTLQEEGAHLAICTNKREALAHPLLKALNLAQWFAIVICADTLEERKPSPVPLQHIIGHLGADRAIMIGDTMTDYEAAEAANIPSLIATFGYGHDDRDLGQAEGFGSYRDLTALILKRLGGQA